MVLNDEKTELNPSVFRIFCVSSATPLDLLHDKILLPVMGWTRNYHTYLMRNLVDDNVTTYIQQNVNTMETMHIRWRHDTVEP